VIEEEAGIKIVDLILLFAMSDAKHKNHVGFHLEIMVSFGNGRF
jgi:hypothetical protein